MDKYYKAHPLMAIRLVRPFLFVLVLPLLKGLIQYIVANTVSGILSLEFIALAIIILIGVLRLRAFRLILKKDAIIIEQGFIYKRRSEIPISKISSVVSLMNPFDSICAAVTFRINTEAGIIGKPDYEFKLRKKDAEIVSKALYGVNKRDPLKFSVKRLALAAALSSSAVTGIIVSVPIISRMGTLLDIAISEILLDEINKTANRLNTFFPPIFNILIIVLLVGYSISFVYTLISSLKFRLFYDKHNIEIRYGIFIRKRILFKKKRINNICIDQTPLMRLTRFFRMRAAVGGFGGEKGEKALIVPVGRRFEIKNTFSLGIDYFVTKGRILRASRNIKTLWRFMSIPAILSFFIVLSGSVIMAVFPYFDRLVAFLMVVLLLCTAYYALLRFYNYRFGQIRFGDNICARGSNGINTRELYCPKENVGVIKITQNPVDIRKKTCKVKLTVRSESADHVKVRHIDIESVRENINECFEMT